ncbi:MAG: sulfotransferase domain-containing protein [Chloroflexota bacterium]
MLPTRIKRAAKELAGRKASGRLLTVKPSDTFITSYPKSGNTWVRFLIANMLYPDGSTDFMNVNQRVPDIYTRPDSELLALQEPRFLKSHEYFDPRYPKVLYIVRDVRSVIVSYYHHLTLIGRISKNMEMIEFVKNFLNGQVDGYGSWKENVLSWIKVKGDDPDNFLLIRYEDLQSNTSEHVSTMCQFLAKPADKAEIELIVELSQFERMKALESAGIDLRSLNTPMKKISNTKGFVRSGRTSDWQSSLEPHILEVIYQSCGSLLEELGYEV